jgi:hypothetical protein
VLFEDAALTSNASRRSGHDPSDPGAVAPTAARVGLDDFIFAYHGIHDPYYARTHFPAFGVFIRKQAETFPGCNATRRDLASPEVDPSMEAMLYFHLPHEARELAVVELENDPRHEGKFWRYWGNPELWDGDYARNHWQWVFEFHFLKSIPSTLFDAVLWPLEIRVNPWIRGRILAPLTREQEEFTRLNPNCKVVSYMASTSRPGLAFISASAQAAEHYLREGAFPSFVRGLSNDQAPM